MEDSSQTALSGVVTSGERLNQWESANHMKICPTDSFFDTALQEVITSQMLIGYFLL